MSAAFAALQTRANGAVFDRLSNVTATLIDREVSGIFDDDFDLAAVGLAGMASSRPVWTVPTFKIPPQIANWFLYFTEPFNALDLNVTLNDTIYKIVAHEPDGTGISRLILEKNA